MSEDVREGIAWLARGAGTIGWGIVLFNFLSRLVNNATPDTYSGTDVKVAKYEFPISPAVGFVFLGLALLLFAVWAVASAAAQGSSQPVAGTVPTRSSSPPPRGQTQGTRPRADSAPTGNGAAAFLASPALAGAISIVGLVLTIVQMATG